jgi:hypothetical protein
MAETTTNSQLTEADVQALAAELVNEVRKIRARIPDFGLPHASLPKLSGIAATIPQSALDACYNACQAEEALSKSIDVPATQSDARYSTVFAELRDELKTTYLGLDYTIRLKRFSVGEATLRVLSIARRLARSSKKAHLVPYIEEMQKATLRRRNGKKAEPVPAPAPASAPKA